MGAAIGIFRAGKTLGKSVSIVVNDPTKSIRPLIAGYVNNPDYEPSMFVDSEQAKDMVDNNTVVVVVDTNRPSYTECEELLHMTKDNCCAGSSQAGKRSDRECGAFLCGALCILSL